jgi:SP family facilitated glucose transporter-like MFS transporter 1
MDMEEMETEFQQKAREMASPGAAEGYTMMRLLRTKELRAPLFISVMLLAIQQLSGINAIFFYSTSIFESASVPVMAIQFAVLGTCAINVIMTIVAVPMMDKAGRRPLLLYPMVAMIFILVLIVIALRFQDQQAWLSFVSIGCVFSYVICHAVGLGPIPPMLSGELFRQGPRPMAMSLGGLSNWLFTLVVALSFEMIQKLIKEFTFIIFICLMIAFTIFVYFKVPETKNKTFEEIANSFQKGSTIDVEEMFYENSPNEKENGLHKHDYMSLGLLSQWRSDTPEKA